MCAQASPPEHLCGSASPDCHLWMHEPVKAVVKRGVVKVLWASACTCFCVCGSRQPCEKYVHELMIQTLIQPKSTYPSASCLHIPSDCHLVCWPKLSPSMFSPLHYSTLYLLLSILLTRGQCYQPRLPPIFHPHWQLEMSAINKGEKRRTQLSHC